MGVLNLERTSSADPHFVALVSELTKFLAILNGEQNAFYVQFNKIDNIPTVVVAFLDGVPVGCGAFRVFDETSLEIKRMYVDPVARGGGVGGTILTELETWAAELGYKYAVLETSKRLEPAVRLYQASGYEVIPNYPPYEHVNDSVCMRKILA